MKIKVNADIFGSMLMIVLSGGILILIPSQIESISVDSFAGPRFMPILTAASVLIIGIFNLVKELIKPNEKNRMELDLKEQKRVLEVLLTLAVFFVAASVWNIVVPAIVSGCVLLMIMRCRKRSYYASVIIVGIVLYFTSKYLIHIRF